MEPSAFEEMFKEADATGSGKIGFPEFMSMMGRRMKQVPLYPHTFAIQFLVCMAKFPA